MMTAVENTDVSSTDMRTSRRGRRSSASRGTFRNVTVEVSVWIGKTGSPSAS